MRVRMPHRERYAKAARNRSSYQRIRNNPVITAVNTLYAHLHDYHCRDREHFIVVTLDASCRLIDTHVVSVGTLDQSLVHPREVFHPAIRDKAASLIVAHNHPSGLLHPSEADRRVTSRLKEAGRLLGIPVVDHVILTPEGYYSFQDEGEI